MPGEAYCGKSLHNPSSLIQYSVFKRLNPALHTSMTALYFPLCLLNFLGSYQYTLFIFRKVEDLLVVQLGWQRCYTKVSKPRDYRAMPSY